MSPDVLAAMVAHARETRPAECCGILVGRDGRITGARRAANLSDDPNRFELDPQAHVRAVREARGTDREVVGFYHSHPHSAPFPSATDLAGSTYPDAVHVIIGFPQAGDDAVVRAFLIRPNGFDELALTALPPG